MKSGIVMVAVMAVEAGPRWVADPFRRHELRFHSGTSWTALVYNPTGPAVDAPDQQGRLRRLLTPALSTLSRVSPQAVVGSGAAALLVAGGAVIAAQAPGGGALARTRTTTAPPALTHALTQALTQASIPQLDPAAQQAVPAGRPQSSAMQPTTAPSRTASVMRLATPRTKAVHRSPAKPASGGSTHH
jgi:hypothetical protein